MYQEKYFHVYCDRHGNSYRVSLQEWGYSGAAIEVECGTRQFSIDLESDSDLKLGQVRPSKGTATFVSDTGFDLMELFTGDEDTYLLVLYRNGGLNWQGNVVPNGFTQGNFDDRRTQLRVSASDNLAMLKSTPFTDENGDSYSLTRGAEQSFLWVLKEALKKTKILMPIWTMVDLKALLSIIWTPYEAYVEIPLSTGDSSPMTIMDRTRVGRPSLRDIIVTGVSIRVEGYEFKALNVESVPYDRGYIITVVTDDLFPAAPISGDTVFEVSDTPPEQSGVVLSRRGHFNDVDPSEIGIFKEGVDFDFLNIGDKLIISESTSGNDGTYTVTGFLSSVPPDAPYIRIQLTPQVPVQVHENVVVNIISVTADHPDPLAVTTHNINTWVLDSNIEGKTYFEARGGAMSTWDVMEAIARQWGVVIQQNNGHWEIKRWNADKLPAEDFTWFVYNSEGVQTGNETLGQDVLMPCVAKENQYRIFGTTLRMDRVLARAIVNYKYKYRQDGDSLRNLIVNPNFEGSFNPAPWGWTRIKTDVNVLLPIHTLSAEPEVADLPPGFSSGVRIENYSDTRTLNNLTELSDSSVLKGDSLQISFWHKVTGASGGIGIYSIAVYENLSHAMSTSTGQPYNVPRGTGNKVYCAVNSGENNSPNRGGDTEETVLTGSWNEITEQAETHFRFTAPTGDVNGSINGWRKITVELPEVPVDGYLKFEIFGAAQNTFAIRNSLSGQVERIFPSPVFAPNNNAPRGTPRVGRDYVEAKRIYWPQSQGARLLVTGVFIGRIVDPGNKVVPQIDPFMYPDFQAQLTRRFTDTIPEIEVLTGDNYGELSEDRISGMSINGRPTTMWDTWDSRYGWSRQGLVTAKSVMELYWTPTVMLECTISLDGLNWSSRIQFEELPGKRFVILRGSIGGKDSEFTGTLTEIHDGATPALPPGGNDGGNTVTPNWQPTGVYRCAKSLDTGLNTGVVETVERDINGASPTHGQERWVVSGTDTDTCPIGLPDDLLWGEQLVLDVNNLRNFPLEKSGDMFQVTFSNNDNDRYLRVLHRADLGTIRSITYPGGYENISGWVYEPDVVISGYTYKHIRLSWFVGVISDFPITFVIN